MCLRGASSGVWEWEERIYSKDGKGKMERANVLVDPDTQEVSIRLRSALGMLPSGQGKDMYLGGGCHAWRILESCLHPPQKT